MKNLEGKVALVTGGNSGIGYATAKILKEKGARVIITGRRKDAVEEAAAELGVTGIVSDQSDVRAIEQLASTVKNAYGRVDILFINAGVSRLFNIESGLEEQFDDMMNINFKGAYFTLSKFIPLLPEGAAVIFLSSIVSRMSNPGSAIYSASKAALNAVMKVAAVELAAKKIRVNAVSPGPTKTSVMAKSGLDRAALEQLNTTLVNRIPIGRMADAEEIGHLVAYLADDASGFITGSEFTIDGGMTLV